MKNLMSLVILIFSLSSIAVSSCKQPIEQLPKEDDVLWKTAISNNLLEGEFPKFTYNNSVITLGSKNGKNAIIAIDKNSGKELWQWNDLFNNFPLYIQQVHIYQNTLVIRRVGSLYGINLNNGQTLWREIIQGRFMRDNVIGIGEQFFFAALHQNLYAASTSKGKPLLFANINLNNHPRNVLLNIQSVVNDGKDTLLVVPHLILKFRQNPPVLHQMESGSWSNSVIDFASCCRFFGFVDDWAAFSFASWLSFNPSGGITSW